MDLGEVGVLHCSAEAVEVTLDESAVFRERVDGQRCWYLNGIEISDERALALIKAHHASSS